MKKFILGILVLAAIGGVAFKKPESLTTYAAPANMVRTAAQQANCHPSYSGCLRRDGGDYDCESGSGNGPNYTGPVHVIGADVFELDRDGDGWGCE